MLAPVAVADLVADQRVAGGLVGNAQQRFGQAHQRHAFLGGQREFLQQTLHQALAAAGALLVAQLLGDAQRQFLAGLGQLPGHARLLEEHRHRFGLRAAVGGGDRGTQHGLRKDALGEVEEDLQTLLGQRLQRLLAGGHGQAVVLGRGHAAFDLLEVVEDRLLDQPMGGAVDRLGGLLEAFAGGVVEFHAESGGGHGVSYYWDGALQRT
ncbi:hypothetical protein D9M71_473260 [compost metagenome]